MALPKWLNKVFQYAPRVAGAIATGGTSELVNIGLQVAGEALTGKPFENEAEAEAVISAATPEQLLALKQADHEFELRKSELEFEDRINTREAITQSEKYATLVDFVGRSVISKNLIYVALMVAAQVIGLVISVKYFAAEAAMITAIIGNVAGAIISGLLKERSDVISLLFGAAPNKEPVLSPKQGRMDFKQVTQNNRPSTLKLPDIELTKRE